MERWQEIPEEYVSVYQYIAQQIVRRAMLDLHKGLLCKRNHVIVDCERFFVSTWGGYIVDLTGWSIEAGGLCDLVHRHADSVLEARARAKEQDNV